MKKTKCQPECVVEVKREEWDLTLQGETVVHCKLTWPECTGNCRGIPAINRWYRHAAGVWRRRWQREVYLQACLDLAEHRTAGRPFQVWQVELTSNITFQRDGLLSLWQRGTERRGGGQPISLIRGDVWSVREGAPRTLRSFFPKERRWKKRVLDQIRQQVRLRVESGESLLDADCEDRLKREFDPWNFCLTEEGGQVFYPMYALGAGVEGTSAFSISMPPVG